MVRVSAQQYAEATDVRMSRPVSVEVDATGYAADLAEEQGEDYLGERLVVFFPDQLGEGVERTTPGYMDDVAACLEGEDQVRELADAYDYITLTATPSFEEDGITIEVEYDREALPGKLQQAAAELDSVRTTDSDSVKEQDELEAVLGDVDTVDPSLADVDVDGTVARVPVDRFRAETAESTIYTLTIDDRPYLVAVGGDRPDWMADDGTWVEQDVTAVTEYLYQQDDQRIDAERAVERLDELSSEAISNVKLAYDEDTDGGMYLRAKAYTNLEERLDGEWHALKDLVEDADVGITERSELHKAGFLASEDPFVQELFEDLEAAASTEDRITVWEYREYRHDADDLHRRYRNWEDSSHYLQANRKVRSLEYGRDDIKAFMDQAELGGQDGIFLTALVNHMQEDEIVFEDLGRLKRFGDRLRDKEVRIEGDAGDKLGWHMKGGSIEVEGDVHGRYNNVGPFMEGGEIRVHGSCDVSGNKDGGTVYKKKGGWLRSTEWVEY